jgi:hypothetical protein
MSTLAIILIIVYVVGFFVTARVTKGWKHPWYEKLNFCIIWPLTLLLYGIHYLHNKL